MCTREVLEVASLPYGPAGKIALAVLTDLESDRRCGASTIELTLRPARKRKPMYSLEQRVHQMRVRSVELTGDTCEEFLH
jgi:hypothetical protein